MRKQMPTFNAPIEQGAVGLTETPAIEMVNGAEGPQE